MGKCWLPNGNNDSECGVVGGSSEERAEQLDWLSTTWWVSSPCHLWKYYPASLSSDKETLGNNQTKKQSLRRSTKNRICRTKGDKMARKRPQRTDSVHSGWDFSFHPLCLLSRFIHHFSLRLLIRETPATPTHHVNYENRALCTI